MVILDTLTIALRTGYETTVKICKDFKETLIS